MFYVLINIVVLGLFTLASAQLQNIDYNVVSLLNDTHTMGVIVDNVTYPLNPSQNASILYTGEAPIAQSGYRYVKIEKSNNNTQVESFFRNVTQNNTVNEYFNRTQNAYDLARLPAIYPPLDAIHRIQSKLHIDGQIPTIHVVANQTQIDAMHASNSTEDISVMTNMTYVSLDDVLNFQEVEISLAGRSSRWFPKLSYNLKMDGDDLLYDYSHVKLRALDTDPSYIREQIAYDVLQSVGLASSEFSYCRLFLNDREIGLFGIIDTFKNPWLTNVFANGSTDYKNGILYQGLYASPDSNALNLTSDLSYYDNSTLYELGQYKIKEDPAKGKSNYKDLKKFTKFIDQASANTTSEEWKKKLDTDAFLRSMALEVLLGYSDGYLTMADNYYIYENPENNTYFFISSDMDLTQGSTMFSLDDLWNGNYSSFPNMYNRPLTNKLLQVPEFKQQYEDLLVNISQKLTNPVVLNDRINDLVNMLKEDVDWDNTLPRVASDLITEMTSSISDNTTLLNSAAADAIGNNLPAGMNTTVLMDFGARMNITIPFEEAVNGPTGHVSLSGVKQWYQQISENTLKYFNATLPSNDTATSA